MSRFAPLYLLLVFFLSVGCGDATSTTLSDGGPEDLAIDAVELDDTGGAAEERPGPVDDAPDAESADSVSDDDIAPPQEDTDRERGSEDDASSAEDVEQDDAGVLPMPEGDAQDGPDEDIEAEADVSEDDSSGPQRPVSSPYALLCDVLCDDILVSCSNYSPFGQDQSSCRTTCEGIAEVDVVDLIEMTCMATTCDAEACANIELGDDFPEVCNQACVAAEACGVLSAIQSGYEDLEYYCQLGCSAPVVVDPENFTSVIQCIVDSLAEACDPLVFQECFAQTSPPPPPLDEGPSCSEACTYAFELLCPPWSTGSLPWADIGACISDCEGYEVAGGSSVAFFGCVAGAGCEQVETCLALPVELDASCAAACETLTDLCGAEVLPTPGYCAQSCSGQVYGQDALVSLEETLSCLEAYDTCPSEDPYAVLFGCASSLEVPCASLCANIQGCEGQVPNPQALQECTNACVAGLFAPAGPIDALNLCTKESAADCEAVQACLSGPAPPVCYQLCSSDGMCTTDQTTCNTQCEAAASNGDIAEQACEFASACTEGACDGLNDPDTIAICQSTCAGSPETCGGDLSLCEGVCLGLAQGMSAQTDADVVCIIDSLGTACDTAMSYYDCGSSSAPPPSPPG